MGDEGAPLLAIYTAIYEFATRRYNYNLLLSSILANY